MTPLDAYDLLGPEPRDLDDVVELAHWTGHPGTLSEDAVESALAALQALGGARCVGDGWVRVEVPHRRGQPVLPAPEVREMVRWQWCSRDGQWAHPAAHALRPCGGECRPWDEESACNS